MAYLESIYGGLKILRDAAADATESQDPRIDSYDGEILVEGIHPNDISPSNKKKLDMMGWRYSEEEVLDKDGAASMQHRWRRSC